MAGRYDLGPSTATAAAVTAGITLNMRTITRTDGWYDEEHDGVRSFRWIRREASFRVAGGESEGTVWLRLIAGHAFAAQRAGGWATPRSRLA